MYVGRELTAAESIPAAEMSELQPLVTLFTRVVMVSLEHGSTPHIPVSHESIGAMMEVFAGRAARGIRPPTFKHLLAGPVAADVRVLVHVEEILWATAANESTRTAYLDIMVRF